MQIATTHKNTDFDALASTIAVCRLYPGAIPVVPKHVNANVRSFLAIHKDLLKIRSPDEIDLDKVRRLLVVDVNQWSRLEGLSALRHREDLEIFLWDHHPVRGDINANRVLNEEMGANITLLMRELRGKNIPITPIEATLYLAGLYEDTGNLMFPSTRPEDARAAADLLEASADLGVLNTLLRPIFGEAQKEVLTEMLHAEKIVKINGFTVGFYKVDIDGHVGGLSIVVHMVRELSNADAVFGIFSGRRKGKSIIIGRSNADLINTGAVMRALGGGGHPGAGSAQLKFANPDTVEEMITDLITGNQSASVQISDLMSFPVVTVSADTTMKEVSLILREKGCTGVPVVESGRLVGVISRRDFKKLRKDSALKAPVRAFMSSRVICILPKQSPAEAAQIMVRHDIGRLPVVEDGKIIGIITRSDAMRYLYDLLPD
ncbi:MAG: tRNA nucleotidyl transferase [Desulfococcus sp.]|nr:MAG: tRNA nucleotidyl transferase [Desulfococcus sp.]